MFGTIARMRPKQGQEKAIIDLMEEWDRTRKPKVAGSIAGFVFKPEQQSSELVLVAMFRDRDSYMANAADPEQDRWYRKLRDHLIADPTWEDGEFLGTLPEIREAGR